MKLQVYLNFEGKSEEVANFYAKALNAPTPNILKFGDLPPNPDFPIDEQYKNYVMHTEVATENIKIQLSDIIPNTTPTPVTFGNNMSIVIAFDNEKEIDEVFNNLSEGAKIIMPLGETFWAEKYAYLTDKFGTPWQLNFLGNRKFNN